MDISGFFRSGLNTDYLFAQAGTYDTTADVNQHQTELVMAQQARGTLSKVESEAQIAELQAWSAPQSTKQWSILSANYGGGKGYVRFGLEYSFGKADRLSRT